MQVVVTFVDLHPKQRFSNGDSALLNSGLICNTTLCGQLINVILDSFGNDRETSTWLNDAIDEAVVNRLRRRHELVAVDVVQHLVD